MPLETSSLHQKAVYWAVAGYDDHGVPTVSSPVEIDCRWEYVRREVPDADGTPIAIDAEVWVDRAIVPGSMLWKGELVNLPSPVTGVMEVKAYVETPDIKGRYFERVVLLQRFRESLPTIA